VPVATIGRCRRTCVLIGRLRCGRRVSRPVSPLLGRPTVTAAPRKCPIRGAPAPAEGGWSPPDAAAERTDLDSCSASQGPPFVPSPSPWWPSHSRWSWSPRTCGLPRVSSRVTCRSSWPVRSRRHRYSPSGWRSALPGPSRWNGFPTNRPRGRRWPIAMRTALMSSDRRVLACSSPRVPAPVRAADGTAAGCGAFRPS
jgi:hypothetical protein